MAISHWAPRFVANGVLLADFQEVTQKIERWADRCAAWSDRAALHEQLGSNALERGYRLTASDHLSRASAYYHFAKFVFVCSLDQMRAAHRKAIERKQLALPHMRPPAVRVEIPYRDGFLAGFLRRPEGATWSPVLIMIPGLDSAKEELEAYEPPFLARVMATLRVGGPGQGEAEYRYPVRGDYEVPVRAMVDWVAEQPGLDGTCIGLWAVSMGCYYAPRAVAFEKRIKACIGLAGPYDVGDNWEGLPGLTRDVFRVRSHCTTLEEAKTHARGASPGRSNARSTS